MTESEILGQFGGENLCDKMRQDLCIGRRTPIEMNRCRQAIPGSIYCMSIQVALKRSLA